MEKFILPNIQIGSVFTTLTATRPETTNSNGVAFIVTGTVLEEPLTLMKESSEWVLKGHHQKQYTPELINDIGAAIEDEDAELFSEYDEELIDRIMFPDEDSREGFDYTFEDK